MHDRHPCRHLGLAIAFVVLGAAAGARAGIRVIGPEEVRERFVRSVGERTVLSYGGRTWDLIVDPESSLLSKLGDGSFHPMDRSEVERALREVRVRLSSLDGTVLILPYPRASTLRSSAEDGTIFLSPGIREVHPIHVHTTVVHELGHLVQHEFVPESSPRWLEYLGRRALLGAGFHALASHRDRPREIFAEDFRFLFGGDLATASETIENPRLPLPDTVAGLADWFRRAVTRHAVARAEMQSISPRSWPNPFRVGEARPLQIRFSAPEGPDIATGDVFDVTGRHVRELIGSRLDGQTVGFRWNGRNRAGRPVASGIYLVRWRERPERGTVRVQVLH